MIKRQISSELKSLAKQFPVVSIFGPRQSGKTTLAKMCFEGYKYINFEDHNLRKIAMADPIGFLKDNSDQKGLILDEVQNVPELLSYIQLHVDEYEKPGFFILTGSHNLLLNQSISQSLAGRVAILTLLPFSIEELKKESILPKTDLENIFSGMYPRIIAKKMSPLKWYSSYINTYVEKDVRQIKNITDLSRFHNFIQLCAGRTGQLLNFSSLASDCGISVNTAKEWLSVLESCYIIFLLPQYHKNFSKRIVKSPKLYFYDTGVACSLLGIESPEQLLSHYLRGGLFESFMLSEFRKHYYNIGHRSKTYFWRDYHGHEVDCIIEKADRLHSIEIKSGKTISPSFFSGLKYWNELSGAKSSDSFLIYGGQESLNFKGIRVFGWQSADEIFKIID